MMKNCLLSAVAFWVLFLIPNGNAACIDLSKTGTLTFEGVLKYHIFPGPPNYEDVRKGDTPEPTYIVALDAPICATGDDFANPDKAFGTVQIFPAMHNQADQALWAKIRRLVGKRVAVEGGGGFSWHTGHHHAPLLLPISRISSIDDPTMAYGTPMTTVQAFYMALRAG